MKTATLPPDQASKLREAFAPASDAKTYPFTATHHIENMGDVHWMVRTPPREAPADAIVHRWLELAGEMSSPDMELTVETFAIVLVTFRQLERAGVTFDPMLSALMKLLEAQCFDGDGDSDSDRCDEREESDQPVCGYSMTASGSSDDALAAMIARREQERRWA